MIYRPYDSINLMKLRDRYRHSPPVLKSIQAIFVTCRNERMYVAGHECNDVLYFDLAKNRFVSKRVLLCKGKC